MTRECPPADADSLCPNPAIVLSVRSEAPRVATLSLAFKDQERQSRYQIRPGQFNMIYVPGVGEVPISVSGDPAVTGVVQSLTVGSANKSMNLIVNGVSVDVSQVTGIAQ